METTVIIERLTKAETEIAQLKTQTAALNSLANSVAVLVTKTDAMGARVDEVGERVDELAAAPQKRWDLIINSIISGVVGFLIAAMF